jgi:aminobenzoyl-glutamate utilization protein B
MSNKFSFFLLCLVFNFFFLRAQNKPVKIPENKKAVLSSVEKHQQELINLSDSVWKFAETALKETQSAKILADYAEKNGFTLRRGVAEMPTAFIAEYGSGKPIIAILGEFDALPGLSQKAQTTRAARIENAPGHGCGHNMFGAASLGAALAIKELLVAGKLKGTIRFYGTPAEEDIGGKVYMARAGLFNDVDICLDWHPGYENKANMQSSRSITSFLVEFKGKSAHAATDPWDGRSALDGAEFFTHGINYLREHVHPTVRMHYVFRKGGDVPNVVPAEASVEIWLRDSKRSGVAEVEKRMREVARGAAIMAGVESTVKILNGNYELLINETGAKALQANLELVGPVIYTQQETDFANQIMKEYGKEPKGINGAIKPLETTMPDPNGGSTDVGDISFIVPEITLRATTAPFEAPWHSWVVTACGGMSIGHKGMLFAAKSLSATMVDLFENEKLRQDIRKEFEERKGPEVWKAILPDGPPPIPSPPAPAPASL